MDMGENTSNMNHDKEAFYDNNSWSSIDIDFSYVANHWYYPQYYAP